MRRLKAIVLTSMIFSVIFLGLSCKKIIKTKAEFIEYINTPKNGLQITQTVGKVEAGMTYKPWQMMAISQQKNKESTGSSIFKDLTSKYFFVLSLSANHKELLRQLQFSEYSEMVQVMAFRMTEYISAIPGDGKPVSPEECLFQQTYGVGSANQLLIVFDKAKFAKANQIDIKVKEFGLNIGNLDFQFNLQKINDLQNIVLNN